MNIKKRTYCSHLFEFSIQHWVCKQSMTIKLYFDNKDIYTLISANNLAIDTQALVSHQNNLNKAIRTSKIKIWTWKRLAPIVIMWKHIHHTVHVLKQLNLKHSFVLAKRFFKNILFLWFIDLKPKCIPTILLSLNKKMKWLMDKSQIINKCSGDEIMHGLNLETEF